MGVFLFLFCWPAEYVCAVKRVEEKRCGRKKHSDNRSVQKDTGGAASSCKEDRPVATESWLGNGDITMTRKQHVDKSRSVNEADAHKMPVLTNHRVNRDNARPDDICVAGMFPEKPATRVPCKRMMHPSARLISVSHGLTIV